MNADTKLEYYNILNSINMEYLNTKYPFNIIDQCDIKLTYKEIKLKYITGKNYFVKIDKSLIGKFKGKFQDKIRDRSKSPVKKKFTDEENAAFLERQKRRESMSPDQKKKYEEKKKRLDSLSSEEREKEREKEYNAYLERKKRRDEQSNSYNLQERNNLPGIISPKREFTKEETEAYLERKKRREEKSKSPNRSYSPKREFTAEETAAYLERKRKREKNGGNGVINIYY